MSLRREFVRWLLSGALLALWLNAACAQEKPNFLTVDQTGATEGNLPTIPWQVYANTAGMCAGVAALSLAIGTPLAFVLTRTDVPGRRWATAALTMLLFLPLFVQVAGWEAAFGKLGWLTQVTRTPLLSGLDAVVFIHAMAAIPWVVFIVSIGLRLSRRIEEEVGLLDASGPRVLAGLVMPQIAPFLLAAGILAANSAASEITVTNIYLIDPGKYTLAEQVYMTLQSHPPVAAAYQLMPSILATIGLIGGGWWAVSALIPLEGRFLDVWRQPLVYRLGWWKGPIGTAIWLLIALFIGLPIVSMAYKTGMAVVGGIDAPQQHWSIAKCLTLPWTSLWSMRSELRCTITNAACAATLDLVWSVVLIYFIRGQRRRQRFVTAVAAVAWAIPGPLVGLAMIALLNHDLLVLSWIYERTDVPSILAQGVKALPIVVLAVWQLLERFPQQTLEAAQMDGAGRWHTLWRVILPARIVALSAIWLGGFAIAAGDLAWSYLVTRAGADTLSRRIFGDIHAGADDRVAGVCLALSALYALATAVILATTWRPTSGRGSASGEAE